MGESQQVRIIRSGDLDDRTAQTPGMLRRTAIDRTSVGSEKLWVGVVTVDPATGTGAHHHGDCDSVVCITSGRITIRWGERLEKRDDAGPGDFIFIPAHTVHQEVNESDTVPVSSIVVRSGDNVVENVVTSDQVAKNRAQWLSTGSSCHSLKPRSRSRAAATASTRPAPCSPARPPGA